MSNSKSPKILTLSIIAIILITGPVAAQDKAAAKVNGDVISEAKLIAELMTRHGYAVLETMIETLAIRQQAEERGISVTAEQLEAQYQQTRQDIIASAQQSQFSDSQVFAMWLAQNNLNHQTFREQTELQLLLEEMVKDQIEVSEQEVAQFYEAQREKLKRPEAVRVSHITVTTKEEAERIRQQIVAGEISFAEAARQHSVDPYGRENGGLLPWLGRGKLPNPAWEPVRAQAFELKANGEISPVFQTSMGWDILRREDYQKGGVPPFEEIKEDLTEGLYRSRLAQAAQEMRRAIIKMAKVERFIEFTGASEAGAEPASSG